MRGQGRIVFSLAAASAILAALVPGVLDTPALATGTPAGLLAHDVAAPVVEMTAPALPVALEDPTPKVAPTKHASSTIAGQRVRVRIPVGCERLVSPLVQSAAATQLSRCVT